MARQQHWALPPELRPDPTKLRYDFDTAARSIVLLRADVPEDAYTADALGTDRLGNGAIVSIDGRSVVLTMGYLVAEAAHIWITTYAGRFAMAAAASSTGRTRPPKIEGSGA